MQIEKLRITEPIAKALLIALEQPDCCINKYQLHPRTATCLLNNDILEITSGFGWQYGALFTLTDKGKRIAKKIRE